MTDNKIACVILNYNDWKMTKKAVEMVCNIHSIENVIVVDNCSTDESFAKLKSLENVKVHLLRTERNGGYGYGNNFGVEYVANVCGAKYALIINPDVEFDEELVSSLAKVMELDDCAVASALQLFPNGRIGNSSWDIPTFAQILRSGSPVISKLTGKRAVTKAGCGVKRVDCVAGSLLMVDTAAFLNVGGYDENLFLYMEEIVLGERLRASGYKTYIDTEHSYIHRHGATISKFHGIIKRRAMLLRSTEYYLRQYKHIRQPAILLARFVYTFGAYELGVVAYCKSLIKR